MTSRIDTYQQVTDRIVALLEQGTAPWAQPWVTDLPRSLSTGKPYQGINELILACSGYGSPHWGTYRAIAAAGGQVRRGEKSTAVVFWKMLQGRQRPGETVEEAAARKVPMLRSFQVFNALQADGLEHLEQPVRPFEPIEACQAVYDGMPNRPTIELGSSRAAYSPTADKVFLPYQSSFDNDPAFYAVAFHELVHSTGHEKRLHRDLTGNFGDGSYSREELIAELGASFICSRTGIAAATEARSASYLDHWARVISGNPKLIIQASTQAAKAASYITANTLDTETENSTEEPTRSPSSLELTNV